MPICSKQGHTTSICYTLKNLLNGKLDKGSSDTNRGGHSKFVASANNNAIYDNICWVVYSGASYHVTNNSNVICNVTPYIGSDGVPIGNRVKILITCIVNFIILSNGHTDTHT